MDSVKTVALLPCPCCSGVARIERRSGRVGIASPSFWYRETVSCKKCGLSVVGKRRGEAVARWNRRVASEARDWRHIQPTPEMVDALSEAMRDDTVTTLTEVLRRALAASPPAGAGVVAHKPPFVFDRYVNGVLMAEGVTIERQATLTDAMAAAARIAARGPNGETPALVYVAPPTPSTDAAAPAARPEDNGQEAL